MTVSADCERGAAGVPGQAADGGVTRRCCCGACGLFFSSVSSFDKHRTGDQEARRCLSPDEMLALGMVVNAAGFWVGQAWDAELTFASATPEARN